MNLLKKFGLQIPQILLPKKDLEKWSVIACDQYTQDTSYWQNAANIVKDTPSTLHIILPEVYLSNTTKKEHFIEDIHNTMNKYLQEDVFAEPIEAFMYIERKTTFNRLRKGLVVAIDLETYDWKPFSHNLIRSTEATIVDRIPPRVAIRKGAPLEIPHIMLLVNDTDKCLVEKTGSLITGKRPTYEAELMLNGGSIKGWSVNDEATKNIEKALITIAEKNTEENGSIFMFAAGDGNHSLATAKAVWDEVKHNCRDKENAPERFALVEIVNIFDEGLTFEPIHRVLFDVSADSLIEYIKKDWYTAIENFENFEELDKEIAKSPSSFGLVYTKDGKDVFTCIKTDKQGLLVSHLQPLLDSFLEIEKNAEIDYIHGSDEVCRLAKKDNAISLFLPQIEKDAFFATISNNGPLPRKSFSMGEADEKRFYLECRKLFG